ncbi:hypothetical protein RUND412_003719 [Rhizina undulata]
MSAIDQNPKFDFIADAVTTIVESQQNLNQQVWERIRKMEKQINFILDEQKLLIIRLHNANISITAPLRFPPGIEAAHPLPLTRFELAGFNIRQCQEAAAILHLPPLPAGEVVEARRDQIAVHLGITTLV